MKEPLELSYIHDHLKQTRKTGESDYFIAADEVGRGCLFGPVTVGAVMIPFSEFNKKAPQEWAGEIKDSKKLRPSKRNELAEHILNTYHAKTSHVSVRYIDKYNINRAIQYALYRSVQTLKKRHNQDPAFILLDGNYRFEYPNVGMASSMPKIHTIIGGDDATFSIGCASIIAKVARDELISRAAKKYEGYALESNAGYGTAKHRDGLAQLGPTKFHRKSFLKKMVIGNKC